MKLPIEPSLRARRDLLVSLGAQALADSLLKLAATDQAAHDIVLRLTSKTGELADRIEGRIATLRTGRALIEGDISDHLESILEDIATVGRQDVRRGLALCFLFYESGGPVMDRYHGDALDVEFAFGEEALVVFLDLAKRCKDKEWLTESVLDLVGRDEWGFSGVLLSSAGSFLDRKRLRSLVARLAKPGWSRDAGPAAGLSFAIDLAIELADAPLVEELAIARFGEVPLYCRLGIARIHLAKGRAETALSWLAALPESETHSDSETEDLLFDIHSALGNEAERDEIAWRRFRRFRSRYSLDELLHAIGTHRRESVIEQELELIKAGPRFSSADAKFLLEIEQFGDAAEYVISRRDSLPGGEWHLLVPVATALADHGFPLAATCLYRVLLTSILERKQTKAYHHGADYLLRLKKLDRSIADRRGVSPHTAFEAGLRQLHGRKWSFWQQLGD